VRYHALAADYDGTLAHHGLIDDLTWAALKRLRESGRKLIMVTGRELDELLALLPHPEMFDRIIAENSSYYVLGYYSGNEKRDGKLRNISVKVNGYPDAQVTFRKRYAAPQKNPPKNTMAGKPVDPAAGLKAELMATIARPKGRTGLPLRLADGRTVLVPTRDPAALRAALVGARGTLGS